jgi:hypothetical protein
LPGFGLLRHFRSLKSCFYKAYISRIMG